MFSSSSRYVPCSIVITVLNINFLDVIGASKSFYATDYTVTQTTCLDGAIVVESATYGSIDGTTCSPSSVMDLPSMQAANGQESFAFWMNTTATFRSRCRATGDKFLNALQFNYSCRSVPGLAK